MPVSTESAILCTARVAILCSLGVRVHIVSLVRTIWAQWFAPVAARIGLNGIGQEVNGNAVKAEQGANRRTMRLGTHKANGIQLAKFARRSRKTVLRLSPSEEINRHGHGHTVRRHIIRKSRGTMKTQRLLWRNLQRHWHRGTEEITHNAYADGR